MSKPDSNSDTMMRNISYILLAALIVAAIGVQVWLLKAHWINPDEGAHLMDSQLTLEGLVPQVDFGSRQSLYVYAYVPFIKFLGSTLAAGRLMPALSIWLTALMLFLLGRRLWDNAHGIIAAVVFICAPSILISASVVKTEPLAMLVTAFGVFGFVAHLQDGKRAWLFASGVAFGIGFYVRESTLGGMLATTVLICLFAKSFKQIVLWTVLLYGGFFATSVGVLLWYSQFLPFGDVVQHGGLFPPYRIWSAIAELVVPLASEISTDSMSVDGETMSSVRKSPQSLASTLMQILLAIRLNATFVVATVISIVAGLRHCLPPSSAKRQLTRPEFGGVTIVLSWVLCIGLLYTYYSLKRGFFQYYFRELIPPMALLLAWVFCGAFQRLGIGRHALLTVGAGIAVFAGAFFVEYLTGGNGLSGILLTTGCVGWLLCSGSFRGKHSKTIFFAGITVLLAASILFTRGDGVATLDSLVSWLWVVSAFAAVAALLFFSTSMEQPRFLACMVVAAFTAGTAASVTFSSSRIGPAFDCVWPPEVLDSVVEVIQENSRPEDSIISGAVIWEFQAGRKTFADLTHPLVLRDNRTWEIPEELLEDLNSAPPALIILDGYTEQTYLLRLPQVSEMLDNDYTLIKEIPGGVHTVKIFGRSTEMGNTP